MSVTGQCCEEGLEWEDMQQPVLIRRQEIETLNHLLGREWFERLWIRPEIGLAGVRGTSQCGQKSLSWPLFCRTVFVVLWKSMVVALLSRGELNSL